MLRLWIAGTWVVVVTGMLATALRAETPPTVAWSRQVGTTASDIGKGVITDHTGNVFVGGYTGGGLFGVSGGGNDAFLVKYNASGAVQWSRQFGSSAADSVSTVAIDGSGNLVAAGSTAGNLFGTSAGGNDAFVVKYNSAGTVLWSRQFGTASSDAGTAVAADRFGNVFVAGSTAGGLGGTAAGGYDVFLTKYDAAGTLVWSRQFGSTADDVGVGVAVDRNGNAFITGHTAGNLAAPNAGMVDAFVAKVDADGSHQWTRQFGTAVQEIGYRLAVDAAGNAFFTGWTNGSLGAPSNGMSDAFLFKVDGQGTLQWSRQVGTSVDDFTMDVALDGANNIFIAGQTMGSLGGPVNGPSDACLSKLDSAGNLLWSTQIGSTANDLAWGLAMDDVGAAYLTGWTKGNLTTTNAGAEDLILVKYDAAGAPLPEPSTLLLPAAFLLVHCRRRRDRVTT